METLMDLYNSVQSPLDDLDKVKKIIEVYSKSDKDGKDFYKNLVHLSEKKYSDKIDQNDIDSFNSLLFNVWKSNIVNMSEDEYNSFYSEKGTYQDNDFQDLRDYLSSIKNVSTEAEIDEIIEKLQKNPKYSKAFEKYTYILEQGKSLQRWLYVDSERLAQRPTHGIQHRLYLNVERPYIESFIYRIISEADKREMDFTIKYSEAGARDDTIVIYANDNNILQYIEILREFREQYPDISNRINFPPIMTGLIDGWIGYGAEPTITINKEQQSYTTLREKVIKEAISKTYYDWLSSHSNMKGLSEYEIAEKNPSFIQAVRDEIIRASKEYKIDENNFCFDTKTVEQMKQSDNGIDNTPVMAETRDLLFEQRRKEAIFVADELLENSIEWEDLLDKKDNEQSHISQTQKENDESQDLETVLEELNKIWEDDKKRKAQKTSENHVTDKDDEKKRLEECLRELRSLTPEERKRGTQYLSTLENEQNHEKRNDEK
ncbi:MAG: hypothetical protein J6I85_01600 [Clostridia bacterium]|nr:hypothetical protein [Clostridia bacterium]